MAKAARHAERSSVVRCAIYTRKSTEEGLDQEFNSLDAQREACAAYIVSQRHEGWVLAPGEYDDGGFSGGNLERPGMKRLMAEVEAGRVDVIVVYKVDRLTRSLADFAKIVEVLDAKGASFVSITQAFNTTTSMGRLTLNVLLSFAQFEREVTGERIRDKIAASKRKGMWMGGPVPLGYEVSERKLVVNEAEAELVRHIMRRYISLGSVRELVDELASEGRITKLQLRASGPHRGGQPFRRGTLYHLLANRIYIGEIVHKGAYHPGEHEPIVPTDLWDAVQAKMAARGPGLLASKRGTNRAKLAGLLEDSLGRPMQPNHATKGNRRYRYYASQGASVDRPAWRVAAHDVERIVTDRVRSLLVDRDRMTRFAIQVDPRRASVAAATAAALATAGHFELTKIGVDRITLGEERIDIVLSTSRLLAACGVDPAAAPDAPLMISAPIDRVRRGHELRLVVPSYRTETLPTINQDRRLVQLLGEAQAARDLILSRPAASINQIATASRQCRSRLGKLFALAHLAPDIVKLIVEGRQPETLTASKVMAISLPPSWAAQREALGIA